MKARKRAGTVGKVLGCALLLVIAWERHFFRRQAAVRTVEESA